ncbi:stemmadenine O-acetyltransferase-like [Malus domestica]|uniref:stemmadenine O-acetyltransferase-like n=1 Tax=Malus domestica TaxID=3750 RepID=UPI0010A9DE6F|nr:BAHD acyltransferase At5g47980-like [Malus domestica]
MVTVPTYMDQLFMKITTCVEQKMASEIKVEVIHKETIKPFYPTPDHLRSLSLSVFDQYQPEVYIPLLIFYPNNNNSDNSQVKNSDHRSLFAERSILLKKSLSEALTRFYPFAGEFKYNVSINCNDHGAAFLEAQVNCPVSKILKNPDFEILKQLLPTDCMSTQAETGYLVLVQANLFECGGLAIGISIYHKAADAFTTTTFIKCWAALAFGSASSTTDHHVLLPEEFGVAASLAPSHDSFDSPGAPVTFSTEKLTTRRFVFDASKISALKFKAASATVPNPTRVEVVSAVIWKSLIQASRSKFGFMKPSTWCAMLNLRKRSGQAVTENIQGNFVWFAAALTTEEQSEVELESLVGKLRKGIAEYKEKHPNGVSGEEVFQTIKAFVSLFLRGDLEIYTCSSWCRFPLYETNFGWGKPTWVTSQPFNDLFFLTDTRDGDGIELSLSLKEDVMTIFESSEDLLTYASLNPTVI